jgi:uncharacterized protein YecA (UPF0149 family)
MLSITKELQYDMESSLTIGEISEASTMLEQFMHDYPTDEGVSPVAAAMLFRYAQMVERQKQEGAGQTV